MRTLKKIWCVTVLVAACVFLLNGLVPAPCGAVLPPGANESLAAKAPIVLIGKVVELKNDSGRKVTVFKILVVGRGEAEAGRLLDLEMFQKPTELIAGPEVVYHEMAPGETWLLFLHPPQGKVGPYYILAAHGWYTRKLDGIANAEALVGLLPKPWNPEVAQSLETLRGIYHDAGLWWEQNQN